MALENEGVTSESRDRLYVMSWPKRINFRRTPCVAHIIRHTDNERPFEGEGKRAGAFPRIQGQHVT